jgi:DNA-binding LacI/PurR family transcriptional regulator
VADEHDYVAILCNTDRKGTRERRFLETLRRQRVEGIILNPAEVTAEELLVLQADGVQIVLLGQQISHPAFDVVMIDNVQGARDVVSHLIACGHTRIAHLGGLRSASSGCLRYEGYCAALREHGLPLDPTLVTEGAFSKQEGQAAMQRLLAVRPLPTAVFAVNDLVAIGAFMALSQAGLRVPHDVALAGFDNIDEAACITPALTTVNQPKYEMGRAAAEVLFRRLNGKPPRKRQRVTLAHQLIVRASTGAPA